RDAVARYDLPQQRRDARVLDGQHVAGQRVRLLRAEPPPVRQAAVAERRRGRHQHPPDRARGEHRPDDHERPHPFGPEILLRMILRSTSLLREYDDVFSGDPSFVQPGDTPEAKKEHAAKVKRARETGDWSALQMTGAQQPTKFKLRPLPGDIV